MEPEIIFEDQDLLIVNKPSGWITNDSSTTTDQPVLQAWLTKLDYPLSKSREERSGIVHRLDKETSGLLIVAKVKAAFENLQAQFKSRVVQKKYIALVHGNVEPKEGKIDITVGRLPWRRDRFGILPGGRPSATEYKVVENYQLESTKYSLVELSPKTGRTHQIRIHMKFLGHPIVSDEFYAGRKTARRDRKWCPRLFLHASEIVFTHPTTQKRMEFKATLAPDLAASLKTLEKVRENS